MSSIRFACVALALGVIASNHVIAQRDPEAFDTWKGSIEIPGMPLVVSVTLANAGGIYSGTIDIPAQGSYALKLTNVAVDGSNVSFAIGGIPGDPTFRGVMSGDRMSGQFSQGGATFPFTLSRASSDANERAAITLAQKLDSIRGFMRGALARWNVPGVSIAVISDNKVVLTEGFGFRDFEQQQPVSGNTLMPIGSTTKAFTAFVIGTLVDEGKLDWDSPVVDYLPDFKLSDEAATRSMRVRDLLTHVSGLPRHDFLWYGASRTRGELFARLQHLESTAPVRTTWQYQNLMYMTAGVLAERVSGKTWEALVDERIFTPLAMSATTTSLDNLRGYKDHATGYVSIKGKLKAVPFRSAEAMGPAGSINSSAAQLEQWLQLQIGGGNIHGRELIKPETLAEIHAPQVVMPTSPSPAGDRVLFNLYAMGWVTNAYRGRRMLQHGGAIDGFSTAVGFLPEERIGVAVLANRGSTGLPEAALMTIVDILLNERDFDWEARALVAMGLMDSLVEESRKLADDGARVPNTRPSHKLAEYAGEFEHPAYGVTTVRNERDRLNAVLNGTAVNLEHYHYDVFRIGKSDVEFDGMLIEFRSDKLGDISTLAVPLEPAVAPIEFTRRPPAALRDTVVLDRYVGQYTMANQTVTVVRHDSVLTMHVPGQPQYELVPKRDGTFDLKDLDGFTVMFAPRGTRAERAIFVQPNGTFAANRK